MWISIVLEVHRPHHRFGNVKYHHIGKSNPLENLKPPSPSLIKELRKQISRHFGQSAVVSMTSYFSLRPFSNEPVYLYLNKISGILYFASVAFGTLLVFSLSHIGGAPLKEKILASFIVPFFWMTKEVILLQLSDDCKW
ncbi:MAG: hypothetical protein HN945_16845 [Deltaproteobacteria bacterium]|nr:hypothetical protein [Deltaproteobacteria bacterium]MBT4638837.1 hypothetical protein [Deltaproteobacteria bacterium]MBT6612599.1 hypothetical protein [Deltaproteobacteria bacterium]MBT7154107.1 hypothetical protein [Deltaproteobacteria bacterium]MBT7713900.1 hypothetical protein [Deltaproteobacteria bacterium]